jgi:starch synthase (maltosyl-transferring)
VHFHGSDDDEHFLVWSRGRRAGDEGDVLLVVVNLDPHQAHETTVRLDLAALGLPSGTPYRLTDELTGDQFTWTGDAAYVRLDPHAGQVAHVLSLAV